MSRVSSLKCEAGELKTAQTQTAAMLDLQTGKLEAEQAKSRRLEEVSEKWNGMEWNGMT